MNIKPFISAILLLCCLVAVHSSGEPITDPKVIAELNALCELNNNFCTATLKKARELGLPDSCIIQNLNASNPKFKKANDQGRTLSECAAYFDQFDPPPASAVSYKGTNPSEQFVPPEVKAARAEKVAQIKSLRKDLNGAIADLKAWFPKRTKIENYDIIVKTVKAISNITEWDVDEMSSWGLNEYDISAIYKASAALNQGNVNQTVLEGEMKSLQRQNSRLSDEMQEAKRASREAANESRDAAYESRRAASAANDATDAAKQAEQKARDAESAASSTRRWW